MNDLTGIEPGAEGELIELSADIVCAYVSNNALSTADLTRLIGEVHTALRGLHSAQATEPVWPKWPVCSIRLAYAWETDETCPLRLNGPKP